MKIGVLTYTREYANLGTIMQAYCTLQAIRQAYPDARVELVDYSASTPSKRPYLSNISLESIKRDYRRIEKYDAFFKKKLDFSNDSITTSNVARALDFIRRQQYDAIYVGSDTVLELKHHGVDALTAYWLGSSIPAIKILAAASSFNVTFETLTTGQQDLMQQSVDDFALLGVRDDASFRLLSQYVSPGDRRLQMVPDPTFTYEIDYSYIENYIAENSLHFERPIVCLHLLRDSAWAADLAVSFRKAGYIVASLRPSRYADVIFTDLSPFEQMGLYKYFSLVITHRFHDTIFCLKNLTPVIAFAPSISDVTAHAESKIASLLKAFGIDSTSYIPDKEGITAKSLFDHYPSAVSHFAESRPLISSLLRQEDAKYRDFIQQSKLLVHCESR
jgi:polysaccharide pyruvyl transferase WcaK-like protein